MTDNNLREEVREACSATRVLIPTILLITVLLFGVAFLLRSIGVFGSTVVERQVFEQSYQRSESLKARIATEEANLAEITRKLSSPQLDEQTRANLEAQASASRIRLQTARSQQQ